MQSLLRPAAWLLAACLAACNGTTEPAVPTPATSPTPSPAAAPKDQAPAAELPASTPEETKPAAPADPAMNEPRFQTISLGAGCFWCIEAVLEQVEGVVDVESGYMGGDVANPTYEQVCTGTTNHAEVVRVVYDPQKLALDALLDWFFRAHDPTTPNRQGADVGTQYRSAIFHEDDGQLAVVKQAIEAAQPRFGNPIVTQVARATTFYPAEAYHQDYYRNNPNQGYCRAVIAPKLDKLKLKK
ncbi:MAG: peptide-methionine (S)-S-oxide reductase MsrA [Planctomycetota bacterium]|jgi:peptide-methionine (S)-S-oxide reductase